MIKLPNTDPIPAPDPATPTVAAPAPMNLAAESISRRAIEVCSDRTDSDCGTKDWLEWIADPKGRRNNPRCPEMIFTREKNVNHYNFNAVVLTIDRATADVM